ncbi:MAG: PHP domain-containing protein [Chloroflexota bacterium]|nr:PHP domain-containing protein [Dehalococcoidia bacterium]MDW8254375.1 PHP domain-containing protein [Chloroflexota bacterium]
MAQRRPQEARILRFAVDLHVHSILSDGDLHPFAIVRMAHEAGVRVLAIADHETVGAFHLDSGRIESLARELDITLLPAIEIDAELRGHEIHVLGHGVDPSSPPLLDHCRRVQALRRRRTEEELAQVNAQLNGVLRPEEVFVPPRETFMRPNLIQPLLDRGVFPTYESAARWFREQIRPTTTLARLSVPEAIALIHAAGGRAAIAHPAYGIREGWFDPERDLRAFAAAGLDAVETDYPYAACSPHLFDATAEQAVIARLRAVAADLGLGETSGSDSHRHADFLARWALAR